MKKTISLLLLFFVLIFNKTINAQSKSIYIHDFYITESSNLTALEQAQIDKATKNIKEYIKATLKGDYNILAYNSSNMLRTELNGMDISYPDNADYMVFGTTVYDKDSEYLIVSTYLYEVLDKDYLKQRSMHTSEGTIIVWNTKESRLEKIDEIVENIFPNSKDDEAKRIQQEKEQEAERIRITEQKKEDEEQKRITKQKKDDEERKRIEKQRQEDERKRIAEQKKEDDERRRIAAQEEKDRIKQEKQENKRRRAPAVGAMVTGAVMGGVGIYWRMQALGLYDDYKIDVDANLETTILDDELETARKPNRRAHIIGAGGILVGGIGTYMWLKRRNKKNRANDDTTTYFQQVKIAPHIEYNINSNTNTIHAKMTYTF